MIRRFSICLATCLMLAAPAAADTGQSASVVAQPNKAGQGTNLVLTASGSSAGLGQAVPQGVTISLFKDFAVDLRAVPGRCSDPQSCPASSRAAQGTFQGHASLYGLNQSFNGTIDGYLAAPTNGALADVIVRISTSGQTYTGRGKLVAVSDRSFGYELRFDPLPLPALPPGASGTLDSLTLTTGASTTVPSGSGRRAKRRKAPACRRHKRCSKHRGRRRKSRRAAAGSRSLLTNPVTCSSGSWPLELRVRYSDHTDVRALAISCTA